MCFDICNMGNMVRDTIFGVIDRTLPEFRGQSASDMMIEFAQRMGINLNADLNMCTRITGLFKPYVQPGGICSESEELAIQTTAVVEASSAMATNSSSSSSSRPFNVSELYPNNVHLAAYHNVSANSTGASGGVTQQLLGHALLCDQPAADVRATGACGRHGNDKALAAL